jgi:hypothetical protein
MGFVMAFIQTQNRKKKIKINVFFPNNIIFGSTPCLFSYNVSGKLQVKNIANNNTKRNFLFVLIAPFLVCACNNSNRLLLFDWKNMKRLEYT